MNKQKFLLIAVILLFLMNISILAFFFLTKPHPPKDSKDSVESFIAKELKFSATQEQQLKKIFLQHREAMTLLSLKDRQLHDSYFELIKTDNPQLQRVDSIIGLMGEQRKKIEALTFNHFKSVRQLCTDEQKKLFDNLLNEILKQMGRGHRPPHDKRDGKPNDEHLPPPPDDERGGDRPPPPKEE